MQENDKFWDPGRTLTRPPGPKNQKFENIQNTSGDMRTKKPQPQDNSNLSISCPPSSGQKCKKMQENGKFLGSGHIPGPSLGLKIKILVKFKIHLEICPQRSYKPRTTQI